MRWRGAMYRRKRRGEIGELLGGQTLMDAGLQGAPWKTKLHLLSPRHDENHAT